MLHLDSTPLDVGSALARRLDAIGNLKKKQLLQNYEMLACDALS